MLINLSLIQGYDIWWELLINIENECIILTYRMWFFKYADNEGHRMEESKFHRL